MGGAGHHDGRGAAVGVYRSTGRRSEGPAGWAVRCGWDAWALPLSVGWDRAALAVSIRVLCVELVIWGTGRR